MHADIKKIWSEHYPRKIHGDSARLLSPRKGGAPDQDEGAIGLPLQVSRIPACGVGGSCEGGRRIKDCCAGHASAQTRFVFPSSWWERFAYPSFAEQEGGFGWIEQQGCGDCFWEETTPVFTSTRSSFFQDKNRKFVKEAFYQT